MCTGLSFAHLHSPEAAPGPVSLSASRPPFSTRRQELSPSFLRPVACTNTLHACLPVSTGCPFNLTAEGDVRLSVGSFPLLSSLLEPSPSLLVRGVQFLGGSNHSINGATLEMGAEGGSASVVLWGPGASVSLVGCSFVGLSAPAVLSQGSDVWLEGSVFSGCIGAAPLVQIFGASVLRVSNCSFLDNLMVVTEEHPPGLSQHPSGAQALSAACFFRCQLSKRMRLVLFFLFFFFFYCAGGAAVLSNGTLLVEVADTLFQNNSLRGAQGWEASCGGALLALRAEKTLVQRTTFSHNKYVSPFLSSWWLHFFFEHASRVFLCVSLSVLFLFLSCFCAFAWVILLLASAFVFARSGTFMLVPAPVLAFVCSCVRLWFAYLKGGCVLFSVVTLAAHLAIPDWHMWEGLGRESLELPLRALKEEL